MLKKSFFVLSLFSATMVMYPNDGRAGRNFSIFEKQDGDLNIEEVKSRYSNAVTMREKVDAYEDWRRFEPEDLWKTEIELARLLVSTRMEEQYKMAITLGGRAILANFELCIDDLSIDDLFEILDPYVALKGKMTLLKGYINSLRKRDVIQINLKTFELLELLTDFPEAYESIFAYSDSHLVIIDPKESFSFLGRLIERKKIRHPAVIERYLSSRREENKEIPLQLTDVMDLYKAMFEEERFKFRIAHINEYIQIFWKNKRADKARDFLLDILEKGDWDLEEEVVLKFALSTSYEKLEDFEKAAFILEEFIPLVTDEEEKKEYQWVLFYDLDQLGESERANELFQEINHSTLSHLSEQRDNRKAKQRKLYVDAIKFQLAKTQKEAASSSKGKEKINGKEDKSSLVKTNQEMRDFFPPEEHDSSAPESSKNTGRSKQKTHKKADPTLNKKPEKGRNKHEKREGKEKKQNPVKEVVDHKKAEELLNGTPYKTLVEIFRIFVGEMRANSSKLTVNQIGHLFECLGHTYDRSRGKGGHSMIICNGGEKDEEGSQRTGFTFGSKKKLNPSAIVDIASFLLEYRIYPAQFEEKLKVENLL